MEVTKWLSILAESCASDQAVTMNCALNVSWGHALVFLPLLISI